MNSFVFITILLAFATIGAFVSGIVAMNRHGLVGHRCSAEWMTWRVVFQAVAVLTMVTAVASRQPTRDTTVRVEATHQATKHDATKEEAAAPPLEEPSPVVAP